MYVHQRLFSWPFRDSRLKSLPGPSLSEGSSHEPRAAEERDVEKLRLEKDQMNQDILESERRVLGRCDAMCDVMILLLAGFV